LPLSQRYLLRTDRPSLPRPSRRKFSARGGACRAPPLQPELRGARPKAERAERSERALRAFSAAAFCPLRDGAASPQKSRAWRGRLPRRGRARDRLPRPARAVGGCPLPRPATPSPAGREGGGGAKCGKYDKCVGLPKRIAKMQILNATSTFYDVYNVFGSEFY